MNRPRRACLLLSCLFAALWTGGARAQEPVVEGRIEIREIGVVAEVPANLRGRSAADLAERLRVLEGGVERQPVSVGTVGGAGVDAYSRVLVLLDRERCSAEVLSTGAAALGARADRLVALGPVEIADLGRRLKPRVDSIRSSERIATALAEAAREGCGEPRPEARMATVELPASGLACPVAPCLLFWVGPGWGELPAASEIPAAAPDVEALAESLASGGWLFVASVLTPDDPKRTRPSVPDAESRPGSDRHTFGFDLLRGRRNRLLTPEDYARFVDIWLAPLRRLVAATGGEFVERPDDLSDALERLSDRSIVWYRTDRRPDGTPLRLELREPGADGTRYRSAEWAPSRNP